MSHGSLRPGVPPAKRPSPPIAPMSPPAEKARSPAPVSTTQRTLVSVASSASTRSSSVISSTSSAFIFSGRFRVTVAMPPSRSSSTVFEAILSSTARGYLIASGLIGDPTAPVIGSGGAANRNS